jgi:hypothetical protein
MPVRLIVLVVLGASLLVNDSIKRRRRRDVRRSSDRAGG